MDPPSSAPLGERCLHLQLADLRELQFPADASPLGAQFSNPLDG